MVSTKDNPGTSTHAASKSVPDGTINVVVYSPQGRFVLSFLATALVGTIPVSNLNAPWLREKLAPLLAKLFGRVL